MRVANAMSLRVYDDSAAPVLYSLPTVGTSPTFRVHASFGVTTPSGAVSLWEDQIGVLDVAQATGANQPAHTVSPPGIAFDATNDVLGPTNINASTSWTYFLVFERNSGAGNLVYYPLSIASSPSDEGIFTHGSGVASWGYRDAAASVFSSGVTFPSSGKQLIEIRKIGTTLRCRRNGTIEITGTAMAQAVTALRIGDRSANFPGGGIHYEHVYYPSNLSDGDCDTVGAAIKAHWGTP